MQREIAFAALETGVWLLMVLALYALKSYEAKKRERELEMQAVGAAMWREAQRQSEESGNLPKKSSSGYSPQTGARINTAPTPALAPAAAPQEHPPMSPRRDYHRVVAPTPDGAVPQHPAAVNRQRPSRDKPQRQAVISRRRQSAATVIPALAETQAHWRRGAPTGLPSVTGLSGLRKPNPIVRASQWAHHPSTKLRHPPSPRRCSGPRRSPRRTPPPEAWPGHRNPCPSTQRRRPAAPRRRAAPLN